MSKRIAVSLVSVLCVALVLVAPPARGQEEPPVLEPMDVFDLEYASDPRISPDGSRVVYVRNFMDVMADQRRSNLWILDVESGAHRPLTTGNENDSSPRWSPSGDRLLYVSGRQGGAEIWVRWMDTGQTAKLTNLLRSPGGVTWSPAGDRIAFSMFVPQRDEPLASMPAPPQGAEWAPAAKVIERMQYRADGAGYLEPGYSHLFVLPADGGTPRQVTDGPYNHTGTPAWAPDGESLIFSANRHQDWEYDPNNSEVHELDLADGAITTLTDRQGPDGAPRVSPDGSRIAYVGFDDRYEGYQVTRLYVMSRDGTEIRNLTADFDRDVANHQWAGDGSGLYFQYDDAGNTKVAFVAVEGGEPEALAGDVGGFSTMGRPYSGGSFSVSEDGRFAYMASRPDLPSDVFVAAADEEPRRLTRLNDDLLGRKTLGEVEEIWYESSYDGRRIQGWILKPPGFDPERTYPLILEIHGGPFANYGDRFTAELQLYAARGYVVLYTNPRGSTSYGKEFGNLIHHAYPSQDFDDLMSGVDAVLERGYVDPERLYVTGGSGGGVLTAWIVGHTDRFAAAVSQKPVINWYSFVLTADATGFFYRYWFPGKPWNELDNYMQRSPIHHVGSVTTPTMLLTGEADYRTPISETEQFYTALKLEKVPSAMVRIPEASHGITARPSNLIRKVEHILAWFDRYDPSEEAAR